MSEAEILRDIRVALGREPDLVLTRNTVGQAEEWDPNTGRARTIKHGLGKGSADLVGILAPSGRWFCLEVKTATGRTTPEQESWLAMVRGMGGFACVVRSVVDARAALDRARIGGRM